MERIISHKNNESKKGYPKDELILDEYLCETCGSRFELCNCSQKIEKSS